MKDIELTNEEIEYLLQFVNSWSLGAMQASPEANALHKKVKTKRLN